MSDDRVKKVVEERQGVYGDPRKSHRAIGMVWRGILQSRWHHIDVPVIPDELAAEMLAGFKAVRANRPEYHEDSYTDRTAYQEFAQEWRAFAQEWRAKVQPGTEVTKADEAAKEAWPEFFTPGWDPCPTKQEAKAINFVIAEIARAKKLHPTSVPKADDHGLAILVEEVGEVAEALLKHARGNFAKDQIGHLEGIEAIRNELIQVAAVVVMMAASTLEDK